jgi:hypothetical protein
VFAFPCAACGVLHDLTRAYSWLYAEPLCSAGCAERWRAKQAGVPVPPLSEAFDRTLALLEETGAVVARAAQAASKAQTGYRNAESYGNAGGGVVLGAVFGAAAAASQQAAEASDEWMKDLLWQIDQHLHAIIRHMMVLAGHGQEVTQALAPMVRDYGGLVGASYGGLPDHLRGLHQYLAYLHQGVQNLRAAAACR